MRLGLKYLFFFVVTLEVFLLNFLAHLLYFYGNHPLVFHILPWKSWKMSSTINLGRGEEASHAVEQTTLPSNLNLPSLSPDEDENVAKYIRLPCNKQNNCVPSFLVVGLIALHLISALNSSELSICTEKLCRFAVLCKWAYWCLYCACCLESTTSVLYFLFVHLCIIPPTRTATWHHNEYQTT